MEGELSLSRTILMLSWGTGFKKAISFPLFPADASVSNTVCVLLSAPAALPGEQIN